MSSLGFPSNPEVGDPHLGWVWDGNSWVNKVAPITTADVALTHPQRAGVNTQEDANQYIADSLSKLIDEDGNPIGGDGTPVHIDEAPPEDPQEGQQWLETPADGDAKMWVYDGAHWLEHPGSGGGGSSDNNIISDDPSDDGSSQAPAESYWQETGPNSIEALARNVHADHTTHKRVQSINSFTLGTIKIGQLDDWNPDLDLEYHVNALEISNRDFGQTCTISKTGEINSVRLRAYDNVETNYLSTKYEFNFKDDRPVITVAGKWADWDNNNLVGPHGDNNRTVIAEPYVLIDDIDGEGGMGWKFNSLIQADDVIDKDGYRLSNVYANKVVTWNQQFTGGLQTEKDIVARGYVQANDFRDADGNSIVGGGAEDLHIRYDDESGWSFERAANDGVFVVTFSAQGAANFKQAVSSEHMVTAKSWIRSYEGNIVADRGNISATEGYVQAVDFLDSDGNSIVNTNYNHLIDSFTTLQAAIADEDTLEGVKTALTNALGGLIEKFEGMKNV